MEDNYKYECENEHEAEVTSSELQEILDDTGCPECGGQITSVEPEDVDVECQTCMHAETTHWEEVPAYLFAGCGYCSRNDIESKVHVKDSDQHRQATYLDYQKGVVTKHLYRVGRPDYWEAVIHFCKEAELAQILADEVVRAAPTGYYTVPAVCFTETPLMHANEIKAVHGTYGIAFLKSQLIRYGGAPIIQLPDRLIQAQNGKGGFAPELKPFLNVLRIPGTIPPGKKRIDFLHEREWRVASDVKFCDLPPLGLVLPDGTPEQKFGGPNGRVIMDGAFRFGEIEIDR